MGTTSIPNLTNRLLRYSATASLVTSGLITLTPQKVFAGGTITNDWGDLVLGVGDSESISLDGPGDYELSISVTASGILGYVFTSLSLLGSNTGVPSWAYAFAIPAGSPISVNASPWVSLTSMMSMSYLGNYGDWMNEDGSGMKYLGFRFMGDDAAEHYAWVELTVTSLRNGGPQVILHRSGMDSPAGSGLPASVELANAQGASSLQVVAASAFAVVGGALTWIRRKLRV